MNWGAWLIWGFAATVVLTSTMAGSQWLGITRMNLPYMLGTMFTPSRDRAKLVGAALHFLNGMALSLVYVATFHVWGAASWWLGVLVGLAHSTFVLTVVMPNLPSIHPRMATEEYGPTVVRQLEPPGFMGLHYGVRTPLSVVFAHVLFGLILGLFYSVH